MPYRETHSKPFGPTAVSTTVALWAPASGRRPRLTKGVFTLTGAADTSFYLLDGTAAAAGTIGILALDSAANAVPVDFGAGGLLSSAVDMPLGIKAVSGTGTVVAHLVGREERS